MPAKANWLRKLRRLQSLGDELTTIELATVFEISIRRAQQLTASVPAHRTYGNVRIMRRDDVLKVLMGKASTLDNQHELDRLQALRDKISQWNQDITDTDRLIVAAPVNVVNTSLDGLPAGVSIRPGRIEIDVNDGRHALELLLTLCFAIKNSFDLFDLSVKRP